MHKKLLTLLAFTLLTTMSFGTTIYIHGKMVNTNGGSVAVEYSLDNFKTSTTIYTTSTGTTTSTFRDTFNTSDTSGVAWFRVLTCGRTYMYSDSVFWSAARGGTVVLTPLLDYCPGLNCYAGFTFTVNDSLVTFSNTSSGSNPSGTLSYTWDFGDGSSSNAKDPSHIYLKDSTYPVCLYIYDSSASCGDTFCTSVTTGRNNTPACMAKFSVVKDSNSKYGIVIINQSKGPSGMSYHWDFGDGNSSTQKNPNHTYKNFGYYYLCLSISYSGTNCRSMFCDSIGMDSSGKMLKAGFSIIVVDEVLSAGNDIKDNIKVYPNPVYQTLNVNVPKGISVSGYTIMDVRGVKLIEKNNPAELQEINVSDLSKGTYFIQINTESGIVSRKFSKL